MKKNLFRKTLFSQPHVRQLNNFIENRLKKKYAKGPLSMCRAIDPSSWNLKSPTPAEIEPQIKKVVDKLDAFSGTFPAKLPATADQTAREVYTGEVDQLYWEYCKKQFTDHSPLPEIDSTAEIDELFDPAKYTTDTVNQHSKALSGLKKMLARDERSRPFLDACKIKFQQLRQITDVSAVASGLLKPEQWTEVESNDFHLQQALKMFSKKTQNQTYRLSNNATQKAADRLAFTRWYEANTHAYVKVLRLSISDLPLKGNMREIRAFEADPSPTNKKMLSDRLKNQQEAIIKKISLLANPSDRKSFDVYKELGKR